MEKKIENIYDFLDYRVVLNEDFFMRSTANPGYSLRAYSRDLGLSPSFLSDVLRRKKDLGPQNLKAIFRKLGFADKELTYIENLALIPFDPDGFEKKTNSFVKKHFNRHTQVENVSKTSFLQSIEHYIVYRIVRKVSKIEDIYAFTDQLSLSRETVLAMISDFLEQKYLVEKPEGLFATDLSLESHFDKRIPQLIKDFTDFLVKKIEDRGGLKIPDQLTHGFVLGLNEDAYRQAMETFKHYINQLVRLESRSEEVVRFLFVSSTWFSIERTGASTNRDR